MGLPVTKGLHAALETHNPNLKIRFFRSLIHQSPDAVVGDEVHQDFLADHLRRSAAQNVHVHGRLDVVEKQLDIPPLEVKLGTDDLNPLANSAHPILKYQGIMLVKKR